MNDVLPVLLAFLLFLLLSFLFSLWYARRLRTQAQLYDPVWYTGADASKTTPLGYYSAQHGHRIAPVLRKEPRG